MQKLVIACAACLTLPACQTTEALEGAGIDYRMPRTDAAATISSELERCDPIQVSTTVELAATPGVDYRPDRVFRVSGDQLASNRIKRNVTITTSAEGVLSGINSEAADRTPQIIGNVLKFATSTITTFVGRGKVQEEAVELTCTLEAAAALTRRTAIKRQIAELRDGLGGQTGYDEHRRTLRHIAALASEAEALRENVLKIKTNRAIFLQQTAAALLSPRYDFALDPATSNVAARDGTQGVSGSLPAESFARWFRASPEQAEIDKLIALTWRADVLQSPKEEPIDRTGLRDCKLALRTPAVRLYRLSVKNKDELLAEAILPLAQLNDPENVCLDVGFGERRVIDLSYDAFGRATKFGWESDARAEAVTAGLTEVAPSAEGLIGAVRGPDRTARQQTEIDRLKTLLEYNQLKACEAILQSGGFDCDVDE